MKIQLLIILLLAFVMSAHCQKLTLHGKVIDAASKEALPFVNISIQGTSAGTTTGIDGRFSLRAEAESPLVASYVGYENLVLKVKDDTTFLVIELKESTKLLEAVEVIAGENPAFRIIRNAVKNKSRNNPENLTSFIYKAYHKFYATAEGLADLPSDTTRLAEFIKNYHLFLNESYTERKHLKPNLDKETVLGNRMSGVKDPFFAIMATSFQPFSFYKDHITLLDKNYPNPISAGSTNRYDFELADTIVRQADTTFIIAFKPLEGKIFEGLTGVLYINSLDYAIEHVLAETHDEKSLMTIKIQQKYQFISEHWFPIQLNTEFILTENKIANRKVKYVHRSYLTDIQINPMLSKKEFDLLNVEFDPTANKKSEAFWSEARLDSLSHKEKNTYVLYDSLDKHNKLATLNAIVKGGEALAVGKFKVGKFYIPTEGLFRINKYEDFHFGLGLETGEQISRAVILSAYSGYGVKDEAFKYGGALQFNINRSTDLYLKFSYRQDILEPGSSNFIKGPPAASGGQSLRNWLALRMDSIRQMKALLHFRPFHFGQLSVFIQRQAHNPTYAYVFTPEENDSQHNFTVAETGFQLRYAYRENHAQVGQHKIIIDYAYPQINFYFSRSLKKIWESEFSFTKAEVKFDYQFLTLGLGKTALQLSAVLVLGDAPYSYLFNGKGAYFDNSWWNGLIVPNHFQTMGLYEFLSDRYASLFIQHNFGRLTGTRSKHFRPELSLIQRTGIGDLKKPDNHKEIFYKTLTKGFFESGMVVSNILRFKYLKIIYYGFGAGVFYRYGPYRLEPIDRNLTVKLLITASF